MSFPEAPFPPRTGVRGMVNAADQLAAIAGVGALEQGGSAADAAVAAAAVMAVTSPHLCGMGGDALAVVSAPGSDPLAMLAVGRAGSGVDAARLRASGHSVMTVRGDIHSVPVPGAVDGWLSLHDRFGRLPLCDVLAPAIELADQGFVASILLALASHLVAGKPGTQELCADGPPDPGDLIRLPGVARTLRAIVAEGREGFYSGEFGTALVALGNGIFTPADLERGITEWCEPLRLRVWGQDLWTVPPPSQGYLTLAGSWIAEHAGIGEDPSDPLWPHLVVEATRAAGYATGRACSTTVPTAGRSSRSSGSVTPWGASSPTWPHCRMCRRIHPRRGARRCPGSVTVTPPTCVPSTPMASASR